MSDSSKFVNAYIENSMSMIQEQVALILQLKTQIKVTDDIIAEKDATISSLQNELIEFKTELQSTQSQLNENTSSTNEQINQSRADARRWEDEVNVLRAKVEHIDTFTNQINEMKLMIRDREEQIEKLKEKLEPKSSKTLPKKDINKKELVKEVEKPATIEMEEQAKTDDF